MRAAVWRSNPANHQPAPVFRGIGEDSRGKPIESPTRELPSEDYLSKHSALFRAVGQRRRFWKMVDEMKEPMETAEGRLEPGLGGVGTKVSGELNQMVDELLEELEQKLGAVSAEIMAKMDDMSRRLDNLEASIQAQNNQSANPS